MQYLGDYELLEQLGVGGMAEVHLAKARGTNGFERLLVVKTIRPHVAGDPEFIRMFVDEANIAVRLCHPNIARVYELGRDNDTYFIAMEHLSGVDLGAIVRAARNFGRPLPASHACFIVARICDALHYAHALKDGRRRHLGIVHRDVTPDNIIVGFEGDVKLIDFGIATAATRREHTNNGWIKGKPRYMAPEQVADGCSADYRADIYSAGVVLYELLTGAKMYGRMPDWQILQRLRNPRPPVPPSHLASGIPRRLDAIVARALAADVRDRYQTAMALHDDLNELICMRGLWCTTRRLSNWMKSSFPAQRQRDVDRANRHLDGGRSTSSAPPPLARTPDDQITRRVLARAVTPLA